MDADVNNGQVKEVPIRLKLSKSYSFIKLFGDTVSSLFLLLLFSPILILFCILIPLESPGSPFYIQERLGKGGKRFKVIKLRSMVTDAEANGPQWARKNDPRITRIGLFIRTTRMDEIPQFINVLKGDMSLIGPRPERAYFYQKFETMLPDFEKRLLVKPGITGWAQVNGGYDLSPKEKLALDLYYVNHCSFALDTKITWKTAVVVITGHGAR